MTAQPIEPGRPLVPRPDRTPGALRAAVIRVAPHRLAELERETDGAIEAAARTGSLGPIIQLLDTWAVTVEIARFPSTAARLRKAELTARTVARGAPARRGARDEIHALRASARESLTRD
ncbi:DUF6247 family protein [Streptomyces aurantiacus]|uniref:Uncharacterized protein n=2 Tax=Streptomyces aurantiacus TaxID=47760 RepID=A0A7G1NZZ7_9ACTN|nr:DUF6247 family protein [Streptomyces aurantiacus]BCL28728.1 hypothetical protein GCM10017557_35870 [Streptomyces aurantiacus]